MSMRKPDKVSLIVYVASILLVVLAIANSIHLELSDLSDIVLPALGLSTLMITAELLLNGMGQVVAGVLRLDAFLLLLNPHSSACPITSRNLLRVRSLELSTPP